jgi:hypothetical protein
MLRLKFGRSMDSIVKMLEKYERIDKSSSVCFMFDLSIRI